MESGLLITRLSRQIFESEKVRAFALSATLAAAETATESKQPNFITNFLNILCRITTDQES